MHCFLWGVKPLGKGITEITLALNSGLKCHYFSHALTLSLYPTQIEQTFQNLGLKMVQRKPNLHTSFPESAIFFTGKSLSKSEIKNLKTILEILSRQN
jgi:hypothetical protein